MDTREGANRDPAAGAAADGGELAGLQPIDLEQQASGVDFALQGSTVLGAGDLLPQDFLGPASGAAGSGSPLIGGIGFGSTSTALAVGDLHPQQVFGSAGRGHDHAISNPAGRVSGVGDELGSPNQLERPLVDAHEHARGVDVDPLAPAGLRADPNGHGAPDQHQDPHGVIVLRLDVQLQHIAGGWAPGTMRLAALLIMSFAAMALVGGEQDAPWRGQFRALMIWLGGCIVLFLLRN